MFGIVASLFCFFANLTTLSDFLLDDLNIFVIHGIGGWVGMILTALFARKKVAFLDGYTIIDGGVSDHNWKQLG